MNDPKIGVTLLITFYITFSKIQQPILNQRFLVTFQTTAHPNFL